MKWDVKHDRAKRVIDAFLDNADYWQEREDLAEGLTDEEKQLVGEEVALMIASIRKRYKLQERLPEQPVAKKEAPAEEKAEPVSETPAEPEKSKRGRKASTGEKKTTTRKPRAKKADKEAGTNEKI